MSKVLYIWYKRSKGIKEGGGKCSQRNFDVLSKLAGKDNVHSYYVHDEYKRKTPLDYLRGAFFFLFRYYYGLTPKRVQEIAQLAKDYDMVFIDRSLFGVIAKRLKENGYKGEIVVFFHNVESLYFAAKLPKVPGRGIVIRTADTNDRYTCRYADKIIVLNKRDAQIIEHRYGRTADIIVPISLADQCKNVVSSTELTRQKPLCLFLGTYFPPNNQGILWFVKHVLPHVNIQMQVVGKGMAKLKAESPLLKDIEVVSDAPDLHPYLENADIMVLPVFSGSGMKVKTCEALMYGKNIIGTSEAFEGYDVDFNRIGGCCHSAQDFINCLNLFINQPRPRLNAYSRQIYLDKYSNETAEKLFRSLFE